MFLDRCSCFLKALPEEGVALRFHFWEHAVFHVAPHEGGRLCEDETVVALAQPAAEDVAPDEGLDLVGAARPAHGDVTFADHLHELGARSGGGGDPLNGFIGSVDWGSCLALHICFSWFFRGIGYTLRERVGSGIDIRLRQCL